MSYSIRSLKAQYNFLLVYMEETVKIVVQAFETFLTSGFAKFHSYGTYQWVQAQKRIQVLLWFVPSSEIGTALPAHALTNPGSRNTFISSYLSEN